MAETLRCPPQTPRMAENECVDILRQFIPEPYAKVVGMYLWAVAVGVIKENPEFEGLCADIKDIKATPKELAIKLNSLYTGPRPVNPPQQSPRSNNRYSG